MSTLLMRANRVVMLSVAAIMVMSLLAPITAVANTDLVPGDSAVVSNSDGANLRSDTTVSDASIISELPAGTTVWVSEGPFFTDSGVWVYVATDGFGPGYVSTSMLQRIGNDELAEANGLGSDETIETVTSEYAWLEPIDSLVVVDYNADLPETGLPVLADAYLEADVLGHIHVGGGLDVTSERIWDGDQNFVRVNYNGEGAFVDGRFVELASEYVAEEPVEEEVIWLDEEPTEEAPVTEEVATEEVPVTEEVATEEAPVTEEVATEEVPVTEEVATEEVPVTEEAATEEVAAEEATEEVVEEEVVVENDPIATTANAFDADSMIGSATVTGTTGGLLCRADASPSAPVLMTLAEGTKVLVNAEAVNGYLGIDCGGLQGFADVNYLWSGGAGDEEITQSRMNVVVTGTGNGLNCRTGAGMGHSVITTLFDGSTLVTRGAASNGWTPVTCAGKNGFVSTTWIEVSGGGSNNSGSNSGATSGSAVVNTGGDGLYCRTGAGTSYGIITVLRHGASVSVRGAQQGSWVPVTCGGAAGFAHSDFLNVSSSGSGSDNGSTNPGGSTPTGSVTVANTGGMGLNCRSGAGTGHGVIAVLSLGQSVQTRSGSTNGWTAVICGGANGFVSSEFVSSGSAGTPSQPTPTPPTTPSGMKSGDHAKISGPLNMRYNPSMSSSVATTVETGKVVLITGSISNGFYPVDYDGLTGYMHGDYLTKTSEALSQRGGSGTPSNPNPAPTEPGPSTPTGNAMVNYAMRYLGYPYVWATHGPASFDCSGFTYWVTLNVTGKNIGAGTWTQVSAGTPVSKANLQPGDLVFFQNTYTAGLSHVGLYIGNGQFIHAQNEATGVVISDLNSSYYGPRWYGAVRI